MHIPGEVRRDLQKLGVGVGKFESEDRFRIIGSYSGLTGLPLQPEGGMMPGRSRFSINDPSYLKDYTANVVTLVEKGASDAEKRWLYLDDNTSIFNRYFKEQDVLNIFQTRAFQLTRLLELSTFHSVVSRVWSESFYKQFEAQCDGVIDFKVEEDEGKLENCVRARSIRGKSCDSRWRHLRLGSNGEVTLESLGEGKKKEIGIYGRLKGPKKK
jgi:hypothetical protein